MKRSPRDSQTPVNLPFIRLIDGRTEGHECLSPPLIPYRFTPTSNSQSTLQTLTVYFVLSIIVSTTCCALSPCFTTLVLLNRSKVSTSYFNPGLLIGLTKLQVKGLISRLLRQLDSRNPVPNQNKYTTPTRTSIQVFLEMHPSLGSGSFVRWTDQRWKVWV